MKKSRRKTRKRIYILTTIAIIVTIIITITTIIISSDVVMAMAMGVHQRS